MPNEASEHMTSLSDWLGPVAAGYAVPIRDIHLDSRQVGEGDAFIAVAGRQSHGREYALDAVARGAVAVVADDRGAGLDDIDVPVIVLADLEGQLGVLAHRFYGADTDKLRVIGITGTNGKTSVTYMLAQLLEGLGQRCALLGTLGWGFLDSQHDTGLTTPDVVSVHRILARLARDEAGFVAMEVSSHGLDQGRVDGVDFAAAAFTNLSRDHLDYHGDMASYEASKRALFLKPMALSVFNIDDPAGAGWYRDTAISCPRLSYSLTDTTADVYCRELRHHSAGSDALVVTPWGEGELRSALLGPFNLHNLLLSITVLGGLGFKLERLLKLVPDVLGAPGRMELVHEDTFRVIVDYAHTPDALEQVLLATRPHVEGELLLVFGCGGDRDRGKRPLMGAIAQRRADKLVLTSDNPRHESPGQIIDEVRAGMTEEQDLYCEPDRRRAIEHALSAAAPGDMVLIAGKGHESYQEIAGVRQPFSDRDCVEHYFANIDQAGR